jgi:hypothetical protein
VYPGKGDMFSRDLLAAASRRARGAVDDTRRTIEETRGGDWFSAAIECGKHDLFQHNAVAIHHQAAARSSSGQQQAPQTQTPSRRRWVELVVRWEDPNAVVGGSGGGSGSSESSVQSTHSHAPQGNRAALFGALVPGEAGSALKFPFQPTHVQDVQWGRRTDGCVWPASAAREASGFGGSSADLFRGGSGVGTPGSSGFASPTILGRNSGFASPTILGSPSGATSPIFAVKSPSSPHATDADFAEAELPKVLPSIPEGGIVTIRLEFDDDPEVLGALFVTGPTEAGADHTDGHGVSSADQSLPTTLQRTLVTEQVPNGAVPFVGVVGSRVTILGITSSLVGPNLVGSGEMHSSGEASAASWHGSVPPLVAVDIFTGLVVSRCRNPGHCCSLSGERRTHVKELNGGPGHAFSACLSDAFAPATNQCVEVVARWQHQGVSDHVALFGAVQHDGASRALHTLPSSSPNLCWWRGSNGTSSMANTPDGTFAVFPPGADVVVRLDYTGGDHLGVLSVTVPGTDDGGALVVIADSLPPDCVPFVSVSGASVSVLRHAWLRRDEAARAPRFPDNSPINFFSSSAVFSRGLAVFDRNSAFLAPDRRKLCGTKTDRSESACVAGPLEPGPGESVQFSAVMSDLGGGHATFGVVCRDVAQFELINPQSIRPTKWWRSMDGPASAGGTRLADLELIPAGAEVRIRLDYSSGDGTRGVFSATVPAVDEGQGQDVVLADDLPPACVPYVAINGFAEVEVSEYRKFTTAVSPIQARLVMVLREQNPQFLDGAVGVALGREVLFPCALAARRLPRLLETSSVVKNHSCAAVLTVVEKVLSGTPPLLCVDEAREECPSASHLSLVLAAAIQLETPPMFVVEVLNSIEGLVSAESVIPLLATMEEAEDGGLHVSSSSALGDLGDPWEILEKWAISEASRHLHDLPSSATKRLRKLRCAELIRQEACSFSLFAPMSVAVPVELRQPATFSEDWAALRAPAGGVFQDPTHQYFKIDFEGEPASTGVSVSRLVLGTVGNHFATLASASGFREHTEARAVIDLQGIPRSAFIRIVDALYDPAEAGVRLRRAGDVADAMGILGGAEYWGISSTSAGVLDDDHAIEDRAGPRVGATWFVPLLEAAQALVDAGITPTTCFGIWRAASRMGAESMEQHALEEMRRSISGPGGPALVNALVALDSEVLRAKEEFRRTRTELEQEVVEVKGELAATRSEVAELRDLVKALGIFQQRTQDG